MKCIMYASFVGLAALAMAINPVGDTHSDIPEQIVVYTEEAKGPAILPVPETVEVPPYEMQEVEVIASPAEIEEKAPEIDEDELYILAHLICGEAQGCSRELQEAVGSVVLNRVSHPGYPNSIEGVVFQRGQYACTWDGNYYRTPTQTNWDVARYLLTEGSQLPGDVIFQAQHRQGNYVYKKIENEYFCGVK